MRTLARRTALLVIVAAVACGGGGTTDTGIGPPAQIVKAQGDAQQATVASALTVRPTVIVQDANGRAVPNTTVTFTVTNGGGWVVPATITTDEQGRASAAWYMGPRPGANQQLRAVAGNWSADFVATATALEFGRIYFGAEQYIEFIPGELPLIISAPHGGTLLPAGIPDRNGPNATTVRDTNTEELAREIANRFRARTGRAPSLIICRLNRRKLDANREIVEAAEGNATAERAWREFHGFIEAARAHVIDTRGKGFYIDLHGHGHAIPRLELGYLLSASELAQPDATLNTSAFIVQSSIRTLAGSGTRSHAELLRGPTSLGALFDARGFAAVPAPSAPHPAGAEYFSGGYNTDRHGSRAGGPIDGVQIEAHFTGVRDNSTSWQAFSNALIDVMTTYFTQNIGMPLVPPSPPEPARAHIRALRDTRFDALRAMR